MNETVCHCFGGAFSVAAPVMAADLTATQISSTEMQVDGTGFNPGTVTLLTETSISVTPSDDDYSFELPAGAVLALDASPVNDDLKLYILYSAHVFANGE